MILKIKNKKSILVAEIGWNFLGNIKLAKKMIVAAKKSGADAVKFQIWNPKNSLRDGIKKIVAHSMNSS